ncbi:MAG: heme-binding domain-containing protein [Calditrichia bacterium]
MKKKLSYILLALVIIFIGIQFIPVKKTNPPVESEINAPTNVVNVLQRSCYDCHSNRTVWPWYSHVAPMSWLVASDVNEGREHLNFTAWNKYDTKRRSKKMQEIAEEVEKGDMPLWYYLPMHPEAKLSKADAQLLVSWAKTHEGDTLGTSASN